MTKINPLNLAKAIEDVVTKWEGNVQLRKYYRFRGGRWYGGIATADCVGCNMKCVFCWSWKVRESFRTIGRFYTPKQVYDRVMSIVRRRGYRLVRISGGEPTIGRKHLLEVLEYFSYERLTFILETNGILIGADPSYAKDLSKYGNLHVRVSIKGASPEEFSRLTLASSEFFDLQIKALKNLLDYGVDTHPSVMLSFSTKENVEKLIEKLKEIDEGLVREFEEEYVFLYPHVVENLRRYGLKPKVAYTPDNIPEELI